MSKMPIIFLMIMAILVPLKSAESVLLKRTEEYLKDSQKDLTKFKSLIESGQVGGFFSTSELYATFKELTVRYPKLIKESSLGKSTLGKEMFAYTLSTNLVNSGKKSKILFTALHHARELLCANMILTIFVDTLHDLIYSSSTNQYWQYNDLIFIPVVNIDSHDIITKSWDTSEWKVKQSIRKNQNQKYCSNRQTSIGVDLNRNYAFHFGSNEEDSNECRETYRGPVSFSEKETQAVKQLVESEPNIATAMNFHTYGNIWIHPFNYLKSVEGFPENTDPTVVNFYERFKSVVGVLSNAKHGNAYSTINYTSDGEASDWMLGEKKIISFSPELGSTDSRLQDFFFSQNLIYQAIDENYRVIRKFLEMNIFQPTSFSYAFDNHGSLVLEFDNLGVSDLYDVEFDCSLDEKSFVQSLYSLNVETRTGDTSKQSIKVMDDHHFKFFVKKLHKLTKVRLTFDFVNSKYVKPNFNMVMKLKSYCGMEVQKFDVKFEGELDRDHILIGFVFLYVVLMMISGIFIIRKLKQKTTSAGERQENGM